MELMETIQRRRSIRKFTAQDVTDAQVLDLLESARLSQSAKNRQPWRFLVLRGEEKNQVAAIMEGYVPEADTAIRNSSHYTAAVIRQAPVLLLILREDDALWQDSDYLSVGAAIEHICLRAVDVGLGALWIRDTVFTQEEILKAVGWSEMDLVSAVSIGYAGEAPAPRPRLALNELMLSPKH